MTTRNLMEPCEIHELQNCAICFPAPKGYPRGDRRVDVPPGSYVEVRGGKGVYHHPDCYNVTGDWDGADQATLGELKVYTLAEMRAKGIRPAQCCEPPLG
jgi:hypothetical protein